MPHSHSFPSFIYKVPVEIYLEAYNNRFPTHELFPYLLDAEVIEKTNDETTGDWKLVRKIKLDIDAPGWFKSLLGIQFALFVEESVFVAKERKATVKTTNETFSSKAIMVDVSTYEPHPEHPDWTIFNQTGTCTLQVSAFGFESKLESYFIGLYSGRYEEARKLDMTMIERVLVSKNMDVSILYEEEEDDEPAPETNDNAEAESKKKKKKKKKKKNDQ